MKYKCKMILDPDKIMVGVNLGIEAEKLKVLHVKNALRMCGGNVEKAAILLDIHPDSVRRIAKKWGVDWQKIRAEAEESIELSYIYGV